MLREPTRWQTHFGEWVTEFGVTRVAEELAQRQIPIHVDTVYKWVAGVHRPRVEVALRLVEISGGQVSLSDVYMHGLQLRALRTVAPAVTH